MQLTLSKHFTDEKRIETEGQRDGEQNIPEMGSFSPAPFEQALVSFGEQKVQGIFEKAAFRISRLRSAYESLHKRMEDIEGRFKKISSMFETRKNDLGRDVSLPFPTKFHWALIVFLGVGEFPLNTVVFRLFGEAEYLTYIMASTLAVTIPLLGLFIGLHLRQSVPKTAGNMIIGLLTPMTVGAALYSVSLLRTTYISSQVAPAGLSPVDPTQMQYVLFSLNIMVFFAAMVSSFFSHDPDEKLNVLHSSLIFLDQKRQSVRKRLFGVANQINGEIQITKSQIQQIRSETSQRVSLYRRANLRFRRLLPPPTFRRDPDYPLLEWWSEVSLNGFDKTEQP